MAPALLILSFNDPTPMRKTLLIFLVLVAATAQGATRLTYEMNGKATPILWPAASFPISYHVGRDVSTRLPQADLVIPAAFAAWQTGPESQVQFRDGGAVDAKAGRDGKNTISITDQLFASSGFIAYTTNWFNDDGSIVEADVQIDAGVTTNGYSLQGVVEHEIGHLLGLDHSASLSAVMFPYVGSEEPSGLDSDDRIAISNMYARGPAYGVGATLQGEVRDSSGGVFGAQVVAVDAVGTPVATALTDAGGRYELTGMPEGEYSLYAEPLDGPVESKNLSGIWRTGRSGFRTEFLQGQSISLRRGDKREINFQLDGRPSSLNPRWIGAFPKESSDIRLSSTASTIRPGSTICISVGGDGFLTGVTSFEVLNKGFTRVSEYQYAANYLWATFEVAADTPEASLVVKVTNGDETAALTGAIKVDRLPRRRPVRS
jgi:hypothetical protein